MGPVLITVGPDQAIIPGGRPYGMASPIEQNRKHVAVLEQAFATGLVQLPKRLGMVPITPWIRSLVLVSNGARISRRRSKAAQARVDGLDTVIKADQLVAPIDRDLDTRTLAAIAKVVSAETVQRIGRELAALHRPMTVDWAARFGLPSVSTVSERTLAPAPVPPPEAPLAASGDATCAVTPKVSRTHRTMGTIQLASACGSEGRRGLDRKVVGARRRPSTTNSTPKKGTSGTTATTRRSWARIP